MQEKYFAIYSKTAFWMLYLCSAIFKRPMQGLQKYARDSIQTFAGIAKTST